MQNASPHSEVHDITTDQCAPITTRITLWILATYLLESEILFICYPNRFYTTKNNAGLLKKAVFDLWCDFSGGRKMLSSSATVDDAERVWIGLSPCGSVLSCENTHTHITKQMVPSSALFHSNEEST